MESVKDTVEAKQLDRAKRFLDEDTDDKKRITLSENRAAKKTKEARKKKSFKSRSDYRTDRSATFTPFQGANQIHSQQNFIRGEPYLRPRGMLNSRQEGPCYKLSIRICFLH